MLKRVVRRLLSAAGRPGRDAGLPPPLPAEARRLSGARPPLDASLLEVLVCPLSRKPLRYDASTSELINEELGIAYPVSGGVPNMIPQDARVLQQDQDQDQNQDPPHCQEPQ